MDVADKVVRRDVIEIAFQTKGMEALRKTINSADQLKQKFSGLGKDNGLSKLAKDANALKKGVDQDGQGTEGLRGKLAALGKTSVEKLKNGIAGIGDAAGKSESKIGSLAKRAAGAAMAMVSIGSAVGLVKSGLEAYASYEQLVGGVETLFGAGGQSLAEYAASMGQSVDAVRGQYDKLLSAQNTVLADSKTAYMDAGLSANAYMETITGFSASLIQSLGGDTEAAAKLGRQAVVDMSDNANKMGTDMESIQYAYQGFAKQNYTMLDNLKLGYGGTKTEMERLLKDAEKIKRANGEMANYSINSFADVTEAIHVIQENMGIAGTTAKEAATTIEGSVKSMKGAWENLLTAMGSGEGVEEASSAFADSLATVLRNAIPVALRVISGAGGVFEQLAPVVSEKLPGFISKVLPQIVQAGFRLAKSLVDGIRSIDWWELGGQLLEAMTGGFLKNGSGLSSFLEGLAATILVVVTAVKAWSVAQTALNVVMSLNPISLIIIAIVALIAIVAALWVKCEPFRNFVLSLWDAVKKAVAGIVERVKSLVSSVKTHFVNIKNAIVDAFNAVKTKVTSIWSGIVSAIRNAVNKVIGFVNGMISKVLGGVNKIIDGINSVSSKVGIPAIPNIPVPQIPMLAEGGTVRRAGLTLVGEQGPELLQLDRGARVEPLDYTARGDADQYLGGRAFVDSRIQPQFNLTINGANMDERTLARKVKRWVSDAMDEAAESMARRTPRLLEY